LDRSCNPTLIDEKFNSFIKDLPNANSNIFVLNTSNFPPVQANSGSEKAISEQIIDALLTEKMNADQRPILTVSDPEPSHLHQKLTNNRLYKDELDPIKNIVNIPGRMHIEMHLLTSIFTYQPHLFIISYFITQMFGYRI